MGIVVTGASGQLGRLVVQELLERVSPAEVVLVSRRPESLRDLGDRGLAVRSGDFDEPASLVEAFEGAQRVLVISSGLNNLGRRIDQHRAAIEAAAAAGAQHVVYTSISNPAEGNPQRVVSDESRATEELLRSSGPAWTILRNGSYSEVQVPPGSLAVAHGKMYTNAGNGLVAPVSRRDCAAAAAAVLTDGGHEGKTYDITGPDRLSQQDLAALLSEVSGRAVKVHNVTDRILGWGLTKSGFPKPIAREIVEFGKAIREGYYDVVESDVEQLTGRAPRPLRDVLIAHRGELLEAAA
ncbi:MAG: NAD(P)-dependent oxidoreductase [Actinomycetia bacterium]|nr:NAD(P)-dependent oxidoreductase [Actinomycetes bacterium]